MLNWNTITRTQRNWDYDKPVSDEDAELIAERIRTTLTKQNIPYYDVYYTVNPKHIQAIFEISQLQSNTQGQLKAPMLVWFAHDRQYCIDYIKNDVQIPNKDMQKQKVHFSFGLAVAWTITAAVDMGYCAGASQCFDNELVAKYLNENTPYTFNVDNVLSNVIVGIGHPGPTNYKVTLKGRLQIHNLGQPNVKRKFKV